MKNHQPAGVSIIDPSDGCAYHVEPVSDAVDTGMENPTVYTQSNSTISTTTDWLRASADPTAASNATRASPATMRRSTNCLTTIGIRRWTTTSPAMSSGNATRSLACRSRSSRNGTCAPVATRRPTALNTNNGSHATAVTTNMR